MDKGNFIKLTFVVVVYFLLRLIYPSTIEFGYDQPRLATKVLEYISSGSFMTSQYFYMPASWGNVSNGPGLIFIYLPILLISQNPLVISYLSILLNSLSVVIVFFIGKKFFSEKVGFISALILATHPWWIIFSRMIYNPTPLPLLISLLLFFSFKVFENPTGKSIIPLLVLLPVMFQVHTISIPIILVTLMYLLFFLKNRLIQ